MRKLVFTFLIGGVLGVAGGFALGIFVYPYIFLADIVATEKGGGSNPSSPTKFPLIRQGLTSLAG